MIINKNGLMKIVLSIFITVISGILMFITDNIIINIISLLVFCITFAIINKLDFMHPSVWFGPFLVIYSISYPLLYEIGDMRTFSLGYDSFGIKLSWIALVTFTLSVGFSRRGKYNFADKRNRGYLLSMIGAARVLLLVSAIAIIAIIAFISKGEVESKSAIFLNSFMHSGISFTIMIFMLSFSIVYLYNKFISKKSSRKIIMTAFLLSLIFYIYTGERDVLLKVVLITVFINFCVGKLKSKYVLYIGALSIIMMPILLNFGIREGTYDASKYITNDSIINNLLSTLLGSEFLSASRNTQIIIQNVDEIGFLYFKPFFSAFLEFPLIPNLSGFNSMLWYYETFFYDRQAGSGAGFSLVGEGYLSFGIFGVVFLFILIGVLMRLLYVKSKNNLLYFVVYILTIPTTIYAIRGSLLVIVSTLTRFVVVALFTVIVGEMLRINRANKMKKIKLIK